MQSFNGACRACWQSVPWHLSTLEKNAILTQYHMRLRHYILLLFNVLVLHAFVLRCKVCFVLSSMHAMVSPCICPASPALALVCWEPCQRAQWANHGWGWHRWTAAQLGMLLHLVSKLQPTALKTAHPAMVSKTPQIRTLTLVCLTVWCSMCWGYVRLLAH